MSLKIFKKTLETFKLIRVSKVYSLTLCDAMGLLLFFGNSKNINSFSSNANSI